MRQYLKFGVISLALIGLAFASGFTSVAAQGTGAVLTTGQNCYVNILHHIGPINYKLSFAQSRLNSAQAIINAALKEGCITQEQQALADNHIQDAAFELNNLPAMITEITAMIEACYKQGGITESFYQKGQQWIARCNARVATLSELAAELGLEILPEIPICE